MGSRNRVLFFLQTLMLIFNPCIALTESIKAPRRATIEIADRIDQRTALVDNGGLLPANEAFYLYSLLATQQGIYLISPNGQELVYAGTPFDAQSDIAVTTNGRVYGVLGFSLRSVNLITGNVSEVCPLPSDEIRQIAVSRLSGDIVVYAELGAAEKRFWLIRRHNCQVINTCLWDRQDGDNDYVFGVTFRPDSDTLIIASDIQPTTGGDGLFEMSFPSSEVPNAICNSTWLSNKAPANKIDFASDGRFYALQRVPNEVVRYCGIYDSGCIWGAPIGPQFPTGISSHSGFAIGRVPEEFTGGSDNECLHSELLGADAIPCYKLYPNRPVLEQ